MDLDRSSCGLLDVLSQHLPEATDEDLVMSQDGGFSCRDSNRRSMMMTEHLARIYISAQWKQKPESPYMDAGQPGFNTYHS
jgi:hypothetical protein